MQLPWVIKTNTFLLLSLSLVVVVVVIVVFVVVVIVVVVVLAVLKGQNWVTKALFIVTIALQLLITTLFLQSKNLGYYALKCLNETVYVLCRYKDVKKFSSGDPSNTYTFNGSMKVHRIIMAQGDTKYCDTILIVIHEGKPFYFKPLR